MGDFNVYTFEKKNFDKSLIKYRMATDYVEDIVTHVEPFCNDILDLAETYNKLTTDYIQSDEWYQEAINITNSANDTAEFFKKTTINIIKDVDAMMEAIESDNRRLQTSVEEKRSALSALLEGLTGMGLTTVTPPTSPGSEDNKPGSGAETGAEEGAQEGTGTEKEGGEETPPTTEENGGGTENPSNPDPSNPNPSPNASTDTEIQYRGGQMQMPINDAVVTSGFGPRNSPTAGASSNHKGIDLATTAGSPVKTVSDGEVVKSGYDSGYGNYVEVKHTDANGNTYYTLYAHMSERHVEVGDHVTQNTSLGKEGSTGVSTGPHLHFEVRMSENGDQVDPAPYLFG